MRIELQIRPNDPSIAPLRDAWRSAAARHDGRHHSLAEAACARYEQITAGNLPSVVREPLALVPSVARLLTDANWETEPAARENFAGALAYFVDPDDLIPDDDSHFGYLDDALVLRLALAEAQHEWFAWCDYSDYLAANPEDIGIDRTSWMQRRRERFETSLRRRADPGHTASGVRSAARGETGWYAPASDVPSRFGVR